MTFKTKKAIPDSCKRIRVQLTALKKLDRIEE
jgi:hypothetical protein